MRRRKNNSIAGKIGKVALIIIGILLLVYISGLFYFKKHFVIGTKINGVNCSVKSVSGAEDKIAKAAHDYTLTLQEAGGKKERLKGTDFSVEVVFDKSLNDLLKEQNTFLWFLPGSSKKEKAVDVTVNYDSEKLAQCIKKLDCMDAFDKKPSTNASIVYNNDKKKYEVKKEVIGTVADPSAMQQMVKDCIENLKDTLNLKKEGCYQQPEYTADSAVVKNALDEANKYVSTTVTYDYGTDKVVVDAEQISQWLVIGDDMKVTFDNKKVQDFVSQMAAKYDTIYSHRKFKTSYGTTVAIATGDYGWWTNRVAECKDLIKFIQKGVSGTKEPVYYQKGGERGAENDIGDTYVEVNLTRQHVILYKNGKKVDEADCVSGKDATPTPTGVFSVTYKDHAYEGHDVNLVGENYSSPVSFFIPFYGNVGLHDASWRKSFGGTQYKTGGSHGCVNLPYHMADSIFKTVEKGMPVVVYEDSFAVSSNQ